MREVLILNQYYAPDTAVTGHHAAAIAARLAAEGFDVSAVVGSPSYDEDSPPAPSSERLDGVGVRRIRLARAGRSRKRTRIGGYLTYLAGAWRATRRSQPDVIIVFHNPPLVALVALAISRRCGARIIYVPEDIHPDILIATAWIRLPRALVALWNAANRRILTSVFRTVVLGDGMRDTLVSGKSAPSESVEVIPLWAEPELEARPIDRAWRRRLGIDPDRLVVLYAGNMGIMHPLTPVLDAAGRRPEVDFILSGAGVYRGRWQAEAEARGLANVRFLPFQAATEYARTVAAADLTVVALAEGMERLAVPSRSFSFFAAGRPVLALMTRNADVAQLVEAHGAGWWVAGDQHLSDVLGRLAVDREEVARAGRAARLLFERRFTRAAVTSRYVELVRAAAAESSPARGRSVAGGLRRNGATGRSDVDGAGMPRPANPAPWYGRRTTSPEGVRPETATASPAAAASNT